MRLGGARPGDDGPMRTRVTRVAVLAVSIGLLLFALPLAVLTRSLLVDRERSDLRLWAQSATLKVGADLATDAVELAPVDPAVSIGVYDLGGHLRAGRGPAAWDATTRSASKYGPSDGQESGSMVSAAPVATGETVFAWCVRPSRRARCGARSRLPGQSWRGWPASPSASRSSRRGRRLDG